MSFDTSYMLQSPICGVVMAGFESTTARLQSQGWQLSMHRSVQQSGIQLAIKHPLGLYGVSSLVSFDSCRYIYQHMRGETSDNNSLPIFNISQISSDISVRMSAMEPLSFQPFDALPSFAQINEKHIEELAVFRPIDVEKEIVVVKEMEDDVVKLLTRIRELQQPKQAEIRKRMTYQNKEGFQKGGQALGQLIVI